MAGILHVQITMSHFPMHIYPADQHPLREDSFVEHQLKTSMDIACSPAMDWFHGGLQFQAVHHLFPRVPRHNLRRLQGVLRKFTEKYGLKYNTLGFFAANRLMLKELSRVGDEARAHIVSDMLNMKG
jgi:delta8-fatty-acid desaturase